MAGSGIATSCMIGTLGSLSTSAVLASPGGDYRALVCVFLLGGNDSANMVIPSSTEQYNEYAASRQSLSIPQADLLPINPLTSDGADYGLHPSMPEMQSLFNNGDASIVANVGALVQPTTKIQYVNKSVPLSPSLFSHNSQQNFWQSVQAFEDQNVGWAGRMAEVMRDTHGQGLLPMNISLSGSNLLQVGEQTTALSISSRGAPSIHGFHNDERREAVEAMYAAGVNSSHLFESAFARTMTRSFSLVDALQLGLDLTAEPITLFDDDPLSQKLKMVSQIIAAQSHLNTPRQIFFVGSGGWDLHDQHLIKHSVLLGNVSRALSAFQTEMKAINCSDQVTTFTASEFARTLTSNGDGTDHAWGSHQFIMGGAVDGQKIKGNMPSLVLDNLDDIGRGRIIPTLSVDQYGAAMARWFGVGETDLDSIFPNLRNFDERNIGLFT